MIFDNKPAEANELDVLGSLNGVNGTGSGNRTGVVIGIGGGIGIEDSCTESPDTGIREEGFKISQSLLKTLGKEKSCPRRIKEVYIDGKRTEPNEAQLKGMMFEYHLTKSAGISGVVPIEPVGNGNKRYVDFVRIEEQAAWVKSALLPHYGFDIAVSDVELSTVFESEQLPHPIIVRGRLDAMGMRENRPCIIDFKATGDIDNGHSAYAWKSPSTMDHTQAYMYMWLYARNKEVNWNGYIPDFYYIVAEWGPRRDYEVIQVKWDALKAREVEQAIVNGYHTLDAHAADGWPEIPSYYECTGCPVRHACAKRTMFKDIKIID